MNIFEIFILSVGLAMDAFAVSICRGLTIGSPRLGHCCICGAWFGGFQALMPLIGYLLGARFEIYITKYDHWIAFALLAVIGGMMIKESFEKDSGCEECAKGSPVSAKTMFPLAVATSIDALAVGVTFAFLNVNIIPAICFIGIVTFFLSSAGVKVGGIFGTKYKSKAEVFGGVILVLLGVKILLEHLGILNI